MNVSDDLFQLIQSLTGSEKRYFKLFSSLQTGDKNYLKLFDAIVKQKQYDEEKLLRLFRKEKFVNQFSWAKHYLYNLILKSMDAYHYSMNAELKRGLHQIEFLFEKGLFSQCEKIIEKVKKISVRHEKYPILFEIFQWEKQISNSQSYEGKEEKYFLDIFGELFHFIDVYKNSYEYSLQALLMDIKVSRVGGGASVNLKEIQAVMEHPLLQAEEKALSDSAKNHFYYCHLVSCFIKNDYANACIYAEKQVKLMEESAHLKMEVSEFYKTALRNLLSCQYLLKKYEAAYITIDKLRKFAETLGAKSEPVKNEIFYLTTNAELSIYAATGEFAKGIKLITAIREELNSLNAKELNNEDIILLNYTIAVVYFGTANYAVANGYLNKILNTRVDIRNTIQYSAWILSLIVHLELGNRDLLEYRVASTHRFLKKRNRLHKEETIILEFISKELPKIDSDKELLKSFEILLTKMKTIVNEPFERRAFDCFDFISWLESKIEGRPFAEVVKEKSIVIR